MSHNAKYKWLPFAVTVIVLIALDLWTKAWAVAHLTQRPMILIDGVLELRYLENRGAAWGIFSGARSLFLVVTVFVFLAILYVLIKLPGTKRYLPLTVSMALMTGGAVGNFIDRIALSYVRDFIYVSLIDFPIFNVADIGVTCSAILLGILILFIYKDEDFEFIKLSKRKGKKTNE